MKVYYIFFMIRNEICIKSQSLYAVKIIPPAVQGFLATIRSMDIFFFTFAFFSNKENLFFEKISISKNNENFQIFMAIDSIYLK